MTPQLSDVNQINQHFINDLPKCSGDIMRVKAFYGSTTPDLNFGFNLVEVPTVWKCYYKNQIYVVWARECKYIDAKITHIINACIINVCECCEFAMACPLPKTSNCTQVIDLGTINLIQVISIVFKKINCIQLTDFLRDNKILPSTQSGFRAGFECETALLLVSDDLIIAADGGHISCVVLLDTIDHGVILSILRSVAQEDGAQCLTTWNFCMEFHRGPLLGLFCLRFTPENY